MHIKHKLETNETKLKKNVEKKKQIKISLYLTKF